jgi:hypothetical protein
VTVGRTVPGGLAGHGGYDEVLEKGLSNGVVLGGIDVVVDVGLDRLPDTAPLGAAFKEMVASLGPGVDPARSMVAVGTAVPIVEGAGPLCLVYGMRRVPTVSHEQFSQYWVEQHVKVSKLTPHIIGYYQLHVDPELSAQTAAGAGVGTGDLDGVAIESFESLTTFVQCVRPDPSFAAAARSSEEQVNDLGRAVAVLTEVESVRSAD